MRMISTLLGSRPAAAIKGAEISSKNASVSASRKIDCAITGRAETNTARNRINAVRMARNTVMLICDEWPDLDERAMKKLGKTKPRQSMTSGAMCKH